MSSDARIGLEIERKYIIKMPNLSVISSQQNYTVSDIVQIYLKSSSDETRRVRRRKFADRVEHTETRKIRVDEMSVTEIEGEITEGEFYELSKEMKQGTNPVTKTRHTFLYRGQIFEIDVYPQWHNTSIMETELDKRDREVEIPDFIEILREVTGDRAYSNAAMSISFPPEIV